MEVKLPMKPLMSLVFLFSMPAAAQLHEEISVDGKYVPEVIRIDRINTFPKAAPATLDSITLEYEAAGVAAAFGPSRVTMQATGWQTTRNLPDSRGYLDAGTGSWLNTAVKAGWRFADDARTKAGVSLQHNSTSLWSPEMPDGRKGHHQYRYDESVGLYVCRKFDGKGILKATADWDISSFNYYGYDGGHPPGQTVNDFRLSAFWRSQPVEGSRQRTKASAYIRRLAYRHAPVPSGNGLAEVKPGRETAFGGDVSCLRPWTETASLFAEAGADIILPSDAKGYALFTVKPQYRYAAGSIDVRAGLILDLTVNAGGADVEYPVLHAAPDVSVTVKTGGFAVYAKATGGTTLNTLSNLRRLDYYALPTTRSTRPAHTPIEARFGIEAGPFSGFSAGGSVRWRKTNGLQLGGWYTGWLNKGEWIDVMTPEGEKRLATDYLTPFQKIDISGCSLEAHAAMKLSRMLDVAGKFSWQRQDGAKGFFNGYDRPEAVLTLCAEARPMPKLGLKAGYEYRGSRHLYLQTFPSGFLSSAEGLIQPGVLTAMKLPDLSLLNFGASWKFTDKFSLWVQLDNLTGSHVGLLPMQERQGTSATAGLSLLF